MLAMRELNRSQRIIVIVGWGVLLTVQKTAVEYSVARLIIHDAIP
jgi:hypothetical protein